MIVKWLLMFIVAMILILGKTVHGQITASIDFSDTPRRSSYTKKFLSKYDIHFVILNEELKGHYLEDSALKVDNITDAQLEYIKKHDFLLVKFTKKNHCLYGLLSNGFFWYSSFGRIVLYESTKGCMLLKRNRHYVLEFYSKGGRIPLDLIPCSEYKGEYDNGLEGYLKSIRME